ncbi:MAG: Flp family type IVb pilin [Bryobacterales bacterium]|nr:Flp family type IVb pilin [Bryobacterales bacterium]
MGTLRLFRSRIWLLRLAMDTRGQDMIEYALMAATVAIAAGAILPPVTPAVSTIFSKIVGAFARTPG